MDIASLLPLLMQQKGGENNNQMTAMVNALSTMRGGSTTQATTQSGTDPASPMGAILQNMAGGSKPDPTVLLQALSKSDGKNNPALGLVSALSALNQNKNKSKNISGLKPVQAFATDDILGKLIKYFNT